MVLKKVILSVMIAFMALKRLFLSLTATQYTFAPEPALYHFFYITYYITLLYLCYIEFFLPVNHKIIFYIILFILMINK